MDEVLQLLDYLGITPKQIIPALIVGGFFVFVIYRYFLKNLKTNLETLTGETRDLHNAAREMQIHLGADGFSAQHSLDQKPLFEQYGKHASPMQPNQKGAELLKKSHFYEMYKELKDDIFKKMDKMKLRTLYDYESGASRTLFLLSNEPAMDRVKEYVVNNPGEQLELIFGIASWIIRDEYAAYKSEDTSNNEVADEIA